MRVAGAPAVLTIDVHERPHLSRNLDHLASALDELGLKATLFVPAVLLENPSILGPLVQLTQEGHELGCHGLTHAHDESFAHLPEQLQRRKLTTATKIFEDQTGGPVRLFRAPAFRLSAATLRILEELGYVADSSVPSTRLGILSSDMWNVSCLVAPRKPYHPHVNSPFRKGSMSLLEIPMSCFLVPFSISFLQVFGLRIMRMYLTALETESRQNGKPIVYMAHVEDFYPSDHVEPRKKFSIKYFLPSRDHGIEARYLLEERDMFKIYELNTRFCTELAASPSLSFSTMGQYVARLGDQTD